MFNCSSAKKSNLLHSLTILPLENLINWLVNSMVELLIGWFNYFLLISWLINIMTLATLLICWLVNYLGVD